MDAMADVAAYAGVDTHKDTHVLALIDRLGKSAGVWEFPATPEGHERLCAAIPDTVSAVGIEGTRSYGAALAEHIKAQGFAAYEVMRPKREQRRRGKSDAIDAYAAARNVAAGNIIPIKELDDTLADLRFLMVAREQLVRQASQITCTIDSLIVSSDSRLRQKWGQGSKRRLKKMARCCARTEKDRTLKLLAKRWVETTNEAKDLESLIKAIVSKTYPRLIGAFGVGPICAARIMLAVGSNPSRIKSEAAFSMLCGTSPIPTGSGKTSGRYRLNRSGDRQANRAIHEIARIRMQRDERSRVYIKKKISEGMSKKEAERCLCRYIAREVYRLLCSKQPDIVTGKELRALREKLHITRDEAARESNIKVHKLALIEREEAYDDAVQSFYLEYLESVKKRR